MIKLYDDCFDIRFTIELLYGGKYEIDANCLGDAIDVLIDYFEGHESMAVDYKGISIYKGYFLTNEEVEEYESNNELESYIYGGNYCKYLSFQWHECRITKVYK